MKIITCTNTSAKIWHFLFFTFVLRHLAVRLSVSVSDSYPPFSAYSLTGGPACLPPDHCRPPGLRSGEGAAKRGRLQSQDPQQSQKDPA